MSKISDPQYWHELTDPEAKRKMLKIAEDYEKLSIAAPSFVSDDQELAAVA